MRIFILDDVRNITQALARADVTLAVSDDITLVRPFRHDGAAILCDLQNAMETISHNRPFDLWVLDNDLGPNVEGFSFLKEALEQRPDKAPAAVLSCSSNFTRRRDIESYFKDWLRIHPHTYKFARQQ